MMIFIFFVLFLALALSNGGAFWEEDE